MNFDPWNQNSSPITEPIIEFRVHSPGLYSPPVVTKLGLLLLVCFQNVIPTFLLLNCSIETGLPVGP